MWKRFGKWLWQRTGDASIVAWLWSLAIASRVTSSQASIVAGWHERAIVATWFFGTLSICLTVVKTTEWSWRKLHPPTIEFTPHGGRDASLLVCPSLDGEFYGVGQLIDDEEVEVH